MPTAQRIQTLLLFIVGVFLFGSFISVLLTLNTKQSQPSVLSTTDPSLFSYFPETERNCIHNPSMMSEERYNTVDSIQPPPLTLAEMDIITDACYNGYRKRFHEHYFGGIHNDKPAITYCWKDIIGVTRYDRIRYEGSPLEPSEENYLICCYNEGASSTDCTDDGSNEPSDGTTPPPDTTDPSSDSTDTSSTTPTYSTYGERYPAGSPKRDCVKKALGADFAWFNNEANPNATGEYERFHSLEKKAQICFQTYPPPASTYEPKIFLTPGMITCLKNTLGEARFKEISSGKYDPTPLEREKVQTCHAKFYKTERPTVEYQTSATLDKETESCLKIAVGEARYKAISSGGSAPTAQEQNKGRECFGASASPLAPPPVLKVSTKIKSCIDSAVSADRLAKIKSGEVEPTESERNKASACFKNINKIQLAFLPIPPEQVPFLAIDKAKVAIEKVATTYKKDSSGKKIPVVTFTGKGLPSSAVDLYFFSDPVVVTVETDANGVWTYNLDVPLETGDHIAYVAAKTGGGEAVRSEIFRFSVAQAAASGDRGAGLIVKSTSFRDRVTDYIYWVVGVVAIGIIGVVAIVVYIGRKRKKAATAASQQPETR